MASPASRRRHCNLSGSPRPVKASAVTIPGAPCRRPPAPGRLARGRGPVSSFVFRGPAPRFGAGSAAGWRLPPPPAPLSIARPPAPRQPGARAERGRASSAIHGGA